MTEDNDKPEDGEEADSSDWLSKQFGIGDEPAKPKPALPDPPTLNNPLATPPASPPPASPAATSPPATFNWGLTPANSATPSDPPAAVPPPATPAAPPPVTLPPTAPPPVTPPPALRPPPPVTPPPTTPAPVTPPPAVGPPEPQSFPLIESEPRPARPQTPPPALQPPTVGPPEPPATVAAPVVSPATELLSSGDAPAIRAEPEPTASEPTESEPTETASTIDALFGEQQFKEYEDAPLLGGLPFAAPPFTAPSFTAQQDPDAAAPAARPKPPHAPLDKNQKVLLWIAGGAVAVLALLLLFLLGTKIPELLGPAPVVAVSKSPSATPSVTPTPTTPAVGPVAAGTHKWNQLLGGECLDPFTSPWAETFTVVDCASPHAAQMVFRGTFADAAAYPGVAALQTQINLLCTATGVIDLSTAGAYNDIQFQAAYPATEKEWTSGYHDYFCFVNRSSGGPITGSVAGAHPAG